MITKEVILKIHELSVIHYGGAAGTRDTELMESALARPYQGFGEDYFYNTPVEKASAIAESIIMNHPFVDGNKRTGFLAMLAILEEAGFEITVSNDEIYSFIIGISKGDLKYEHIVNWLNQNTINTLQ